MRPIIPAKPAVRLPLNSLAAVAAGLLVCVLLIATSAADVAAALRALFAGAFSSAYYVGSWLNTAAFLMTAGAGAAVSVKSGTMNLGGEAQVYAGGFTCALVLTHLHAPAAVAGALALVASMASGSALALVSAALKERKGASVLLTSFLVSAAAIPLIDAGITGTKMGTGQNLLALPYIPQGFYFAQLLPPSPLAPSVFVAVALCVAVYAVTQRTAAGKKSVLWGISPRFAQYTGFSSAANTCASLAVSGALHALTGFFAVCGTYHTCHVGFYAGMGWNALSVALIAQANALLVIPASVVLAWLYTATGIVSLTQGFSFDMSGIIQGVVLFAIAIPPAIIRPVPKLKFPNRFI